MAGGATAKTLVTISGECFHVEYLNVGDADGRDGTLYYFRLKDLVKDRGIRSVSLFLSGTDKAFIENFDSRFEVVSFNVLRRGFDSGLFSFETTILPNWFHELPLRAIDFQPQKKASDEVIQRFIKFSSYCLGFKYCSDMQEPQVNFNCAEDFDYLAAKPEDVGRNIRLLTEEGYLRVPKYSRAAPLLVSATAQLIRDIENGEDLESSLSIGANVTNIYHLYGANPRVNNQSTDNSVNITTVSGDQFFAQLREAAQSITEEPERKNILAQLDDLEKAQDSSGFFAAYQSFIASAAQYMTIFAPFIPALTQMLSGK